MHLPALSHRRGKLQSLVIYVVMRGATLDIHDEHYTTYWMMTTVAGGVNSAMPQRAERFSATQYTPCTRRNQPCVE